MDKLKRGEKWEFPQREGHCVVDWLYEKLNIAGNTGLSLEWFENKVYNFVAKGEDRTLFSCRELGINSNQLTSFIKENHKNVSLIVIDPLGGIIDKVIAKKGLHGNHIWIGCINSNGHCFPIDDEIPIKKMLNGNYNENGICDLLEICKIETD